MDSSKGRERKGRGANTRPVNRFESTQLIEDLEYLDSDPEAADQYRRVQTRYYVDESKSIVSRNNSPDIPFTFSVNPYRGCLHGCSYCYARPTHEFLGFDAGLDFESKIMVKRKAPDLLRDWLARKTWKCEPIVFSGVTDCYQPAERHFQLTRACLRVAWEHRQPVEIVTKNHLVTRDIDLLEPMACQRLVSVALSVTSLQHDLTRQMEPRTSTPAAKLKAIEELSKAGIPTTVMVSPIIPGLNDTEIAAILNAAADAGATNAGYVMLRLPLTVEPVFDEWLTRCYPSKKEKVLSLQRQMRGGKLNDSRFGKRMKAEGPIADQIRQAFELFKKRYRLDRPTQLDCSQFRLPNRDRQGYLF